MARQLSTQTSKKNPRPKKNRHRTSDLTGRVITRHGQNLVIEDHNQQLIHCLQRKQSETLVCGDYVLWESTGEGQGVVNSRLERASTLSRPDYSGRNKALAANITQLVVVIAPEPEPSGYLLDQYLVATELIGVKALIVINKADLLQKDEYGQFAQRFDGYQEIGYPLVQSSTKSDGGIQGLTQHLEAEDSILVGQSGVGKSSLVNSLIPELSLQVGRLSEATGFGRHTTSTTTLYHLPTGGDIIDSPGVRSFRLGQIDRRQLGTGFPEFSSYLGQCRFNDCSHTTEPGCAVIRAAEAGEIHADRLTVYQQMVDSLQLQ